MRTLTSGHKVAVAIATLVGVLAGGPSIASAATVPHSEFAESSSPDRSNAKTAYNGLHATNQKFLFVRGLQNATTVRFFLDDKKTPVTTERVAPFDLGTTGPDGNARAFDFDALSTGVHVLRYTATDAKGRVVGKSSVRVHVRVPSKKPTTTVKPTTTTAKPTTTTVRPTPTTVKPTTTTAAPSTSGRILFEDEFNGPAMGNPDPSKWVNYGSWCKTPEGVTVDQPGFGYISCGAKKYTDGKGNLVLPATPTQGSGVQSATKFGFVYGEASAWMQMPKEKGYWPAFWTLNSLNQGKGKLTGEADILEYYSTWGETYHNVTHAWNTTLPKTPAQPGGKDNFCKARTDLTEGFHKFTARFEPGKVTYSLDDRVCVVDTASQFVQWPFGPNNMTENWLILDNAIGGAGGQQTPATQNSQVLVSRVEVRAL